MNPWVELMQLFPKSAVQIGVIASVSSDKTYCTVTLSGGGSIIARCVGNELLDGGYAVADQVLIKDGYIQQKIPVQFYSYSDELV